MQAITIFQPNRRSLPNAGILLLVCLLLLLCVFGVFYIHFSVSWDTSLQRSNASLLFAFRPENLSDATTGLLAKNHTFWLSQLIFFLLAAGLPYFRPVRASISTLVASAFLVLIHINSVFGGGITLEFKLITVLVLFGAYIGLSFYAEFCDKKQLTRIFSQYVPPEIAFNYSRNPEKINLEGESREITVLFCDIKGFTTISEHLEPCKLALWLNRYFDITSQIIVRHKGTIDKYMGDSVMAFWGAPLDNERHAADALSAALEIQRELASLRIELQSDGMPDLHVGIGISSGVSNVGNMGSVFRMAYTVVGDAVNVAERLERQTRYYDAPIIVSEVASRLMTDTLFRELDTIKVKGRSCYVKIYQPMYQKDQVTGEQLTWLALHHQAIGYFREGQWYEAERIFKRLNTTEKSRLYEIYLARITQAKTALPVAGLSEHGWRQEVPRRVH